MLETSVMKELIEKIKNQLGNGSHACRIIVDFYKTFITVAQKLNYYGICGFANN